MVEMTFDANKYSPTDFTDPNQYARRAWYAPVDELDFATACELAKTDREVYDEVWNWALSAPSLPDEAKVLLYNALVRKKPRKGVAATAKRNRRLQAIAVVLRRDFGMQVTGEDGIVATLAKLPGAPSEDSILKNKIIYPYKSTTINTEYSS